MFDNEYFMREALKEAKKAYEIGEIPVGAVIVFEGKIIAKGHNLSEKLCDATAHAEMIAITAASHYINSKILAKCRLFVTLEPCVMCAGAIFWSQIEEIIYGAADTKRGFERIAHAISQPKLKITRGVLMQECENLLKDFFTKLR